VEGKLPVGQTIESSSAVRVIDVNSPFVAQAAQTHRPGDDTRHNRRRADEISSLQARESTGKLKLRLLCQFTITRHDVFVLEWLENSKFALEPPTQ